MSTSLLHHAFGLPTGYEYIRTHYEKGETIFVIREKPQLLRCSHCNSRQINF